MTQTEHFNLNIVTGSDIVNPLVVDNPNYEAIDKAMWANAIATIGTATELKNGSVHALTRANKDSNMFRFVATSDFTSGETFTVDGVQVTAYTTNAQPLVTNAYRIGASVLCCLVGTVLTMFVVTPIAVAEDANKLGGQEPSYYATAERLQQTNSIATSAGEVAQQAQQTLNARQNINMQVSGTTLTITF